MSLRVAQKVGFQMIDAVSIGHVINKSNRWEPIDTIFGIHRIDFHFPHFNGTKSSHNSSTTVDFTKYGMLLLAILGLIGGVVVLVFYFVGI